MSAGRHCYSPDAPQTERLAAYLEEKEARVERREPLRGVTRARRWFSLRLISPAESRILRCCGGCSRAACLSLPCSFRSSPSARSPMLQQGRQCSLRQLRPRRASRRRPRSSRPSIRGQGFLTLMSMMPAGRPSLWLHVTGWAANALSAAGRQRFACGKKAIRPKRSRKV